MISYSCPLVSASSVLAPGQKWFNQHDNSIVEIEKVNSLNATFSATYGLIKGSVTERFPLRGQFDPQGITIGWSVSYWNSYENYHSLGVWTGYVCRGVGSLGTVLQLSMTVAIAHGDDKDTTTGSGQFVLISGSDINDVV